MADLPSSSEVYLSRDQIRNQIIDYIKYYLELENVDLTKSSFLSFLINILSTLTSNILFYQTSVYREFFLTKAQLPESILNLSAFLGYNSSEASYSNVNALVNIPLEFTEASVEFNIAEGTIFSADTVDFLTFYDTAVTITNNTTASIVMTDSGKVYNIPYTNVDGDNLQFILPLRQYKETTQEFQIAEDLQTYQFTTVDVPIDGQTSAMVVQVKGPDEASWRTYDEFNSLYLMTSTDYGYVSRRTDSGRRLYFGNDLIGIQPPPGATVRTITLVTQGADGNVIAGSVTKGARIYTTTGAGLTQIVSYSVTNPSPATGGIDEEDVETIRSNSIANLTALGRLVSELDYTNVNVVIPSSPIAANSIAVLKRSDLNINEVQLYTALNFNNEIVPTRNVYYDIPVSQTTIARGTTISFEGTDYITVFDMTVDHTLNKKAYYEYVMYQLDLTPSLVRSYSSTYDIVVDQLLVTRSGNSVTFDLHYQSTESDYNLTTCEMEIYETTQIFAMANNDSTSTYTYTFSPYTDVPEGELTFLFTITHPVDGQIVRYSSTLTVRKSLDAFMMSNLTTDGTSQTTVFDIPTVLKSYYDDLSTANVAAFELQVLQSMVSTMEFSNYRMLTDFVNVKFTNTYGSMDTMQYNDLSHTSVIDIEQLAVPVNPGIGDRYIVNGFEVDYDSGAWAGQKNNIAQCTDSTGPTWIFSEPTTDDIVYVFNQQAKYIYTASGWVIPNYTIPLQIYMDVFKSSDASESDLELSTNIKDNLIDEFGSRFGSNISLYRSEIVDIVQNTSGVGHCRLITPESSIFFNFDLTELTQAQLLRYAPSYIYFTEDDITIRVL